MDVKYLTIGVKEVSIDQVRTALTELNFYGDIDVIRKIAEVDISIEDLREDYLTMTKFLKENGLKDENPFFNDFDINPFGLKIDFSVTPNFRYLNVLEPAVFVLGQHISSELKTEVIVMFENMRIPIGLFKNGVLSKTFEQYNEHFFINKIWRPQKV